MRSGGGGDEEIWVWGLEVGDGLRRVGWISWRGKGGIS